MTLSVPSSPRDPLPPNPHGQRPAALVRDPEPFAIDVAALVASLRDSWRHIALATAAGLALGAAVLWLVPPSFGGSASILIRTTQVDPTSLMRSKVGPLAELMPGALGGSSDEELSTEIALLSSRAVLGSVVDSLKLQVVPRSRQRTPAAALIDSLRLTGRFKPFKATLAAGANTVPAGTIWARVPGKYKIFDREDAIDELSRRVDVRRNAGNLVQIGYTARDSVSAAAVPNLLASVYMFRRRTVDRGLNQRRLEFLVAKADSVRDELRTSADVLARVARNSGAGASPEIAARAYADEAGILEARLAELRASEQGLDSLLAASGTRPVDARWLAGFPDLLRSPALNEILTQITRVETERMVMLARVPETNPQAEALAEARDSLEKQMIPIARSYRRSLAQQRNSLERDLGILRQKLSELPAAAAAVAKEQAELTRLAALNAGMGGQVLEARLAAIMEGGDVRVVDPAVSPRRVSFPRPLPTLVVGLILGFGLGVALALLRSRSTMVRSFAA